MLVVVNGQGNGGIDDHDYGYCEGGGGVDRYGFADLNYDATLAVTPETRQRVLKTAEKLAYKPRRRKRVATQTTVALIQWRSEQEELNDLYYLQIQYAIEARAASIGYHVQNLHLEQLNAESVANVQGIIALGKYDAGEVAEIKALGLPIVLLIRICWRLIAIPLPAIMLAQLPRSLIISEGRH